MKKQIFAIAAVGMASAGALCAQSLYDLAPDETEKDSLPLTWTAGATIGYDDNPTPLLGNDDSSLYGQAYVGANFLNNSPSTTTSFGAQIGVIHYFDNLDVLGTDVDDTSFTAALYLNWTNRISERLRIVSRNSLAYELEPDYSAGFQSSRQVGNYFRWFTDNAVGYRWSERLATYTGFALNGVSYDDVDGADRFTWSVYNNFRYQLSQQTIGTLNYRYSDTEGDAGVTDSTNQYITLGLEHRFSPRAVGVIRGGVQIRDVDQGDSGTSPFFEGSLNVKMNEQFSWKAYGRYAIEDYARTLGGVNYSDNQSFRLGVSGDYIVSQSLSLNAGINYIMQGYENPLNGVIAPDFDEDLFNAYLGFSLGLTDTVSLNGRYNFEDLSSDAGRDYDRNRFSLGVSAQF
ncbi:hypothetical protein V2O64_12515 [Verrucomicrobiaceae bacterium 227]